MRKRIIVLILLLCLFLSGCAISDDEKTPSISYNNSCWTTDSKNITYILEDGYEVDQSHPYDVEEIEEGYTIKFNIIKKRE